MIQYPTPAVDDGRYAAKRCVGDTVTVEADIFRDGHDLLRAVVRYRAPGRRRRTRNRRCERIDAHLGGVRWAGSFEVDRQGRWEYTIEAWTDVFGTWRDELERKVAAQQHDLAGELSEGVLLLKDAPRRPPPTTADKALIEHAVDRARRRQDPRVGQARRRARPRAVRHASSGSSPATAASPSPEPIAIEVDRADERGSAAGTSCSPAPGAGCKGVEAQLPRLAELGFDVLYLPPIHPIGLTNRKGRNNSLTAGPDDPGSPWAIGDETGGHDAVHPDLGTIEDLKTTHRSREASTTSTSRSTSRSSARPTTRGCTSIPSGSTAAPTARSSTPRTRPSATRTSTTSTGSRRTGTASGMRC